MAGKKDFVLGSDPGASELTRNNHYVPQWYQKGFTAESNQLQYLDLSPDKKKLPNGKIITFNDRKLLPPSQCFFEYDLYTTFFGPFISDIFETRLFGKIDDEGSKAVRAFINGDARDMHDRFIDFFNYIDTQKTRTPKGLNWLKEQYADLDQAQLMMEMQAAQKMNCTIWLEGVREIVSAKNSNTKFIVSDHPVTVYNYDCPPGSEFCNYPNDPLVAWKASQTIFPLNKDHCLILTNYEYASEPNLKDPKAKRTNARNFGETLVRTNAFLRDRLLSNKKVQEINFVIKQRARRFIAAAQLDWLYPEKDESITWHSAKSTLLPPASKIHEFGGEMFAGFKDGRTYFQDAFGRTSREHDFLKKDLPKSEPGPNDPCPCGRGRKYKKCCRDKAFSDRPAWNVLSIRERNMMFYAGINDILGFSGGKTWADIRREISNEQVKDIYELFGALWPVHTDVINLLPRPDQYFRAVYMGIIDLRSLSIYATSATLYFDEVIIQNPFINPAGINPEFSPVEHPSQFKQQTLINIALFFALYPLIETGAINFIPDLGVFNRHLQSQVMDIGLQRRSEGATITGDERKFIEELYDEDHERMMRGQPEEQLRKQLKEANPDAADEIITGAYNLMQRKRNEDPLAILQDDLYSNGGQFTMMNMAPGFEIALFLAQVTGAVVFTDSATRWEELVQAQNKQGTTVETQWNELINSLNDLDLPLNIDLETIYGLFFEGKFGTMRHAWRSIYSAIQPAISSDIKT
ncbi:MAG TPA: hypothetical protein DCO83_11210 [Mucilaginibacter sp.]|jgi:hypothetical protein|nr:hypothetical protein [Mucilaginibacter sp.]